MMRMHTHDDMNVLEHARPANVLGALVMAAACLLGIGALTAALGGCAVAAGAAAGGVTGYIAGHEAGEDEAREEIQATRPDD
jgi:ABC-type uncharacterized transport system permease subunit